MGIPLLENGNPAFGFVIGGLPLRIMGTRGARPPVFWLPRRGDGVGTRMDGWTSPGGFAFRFIHFMDFISFHFTDAFSFQGGVRQK
jgi:hypothetical protein